VRFIKLGLISIVVFFLIFTAFSLMIPSRVRISKAININGNKDSLFYLIRHREAWTRWHPAFMAADSATRLADLNLVNRAENDSEYVVDLGMGHQSPVTNGWVVYHYPGIDSLTLQWYMDFHLPWYPWKKFGSLLYEGSYGNMMQHGLENLKKLTEE